MRIAQVVLSLDVGGQERLVVRMAHAFRERGHDVHVVTLTAGGALRGEVAPVPVHEVVRGRGFDASVYARLFALFRRLRPDVVHTHNSVPLEYATPAARLARVPRTVHTKHGHIAYSRSALALARAATRLVDCFVAVSRDTAATAERWERPRRDRLTVVENGIPLARFAPDEAARRAVREELGIPEGALVIGSVGRLVEEKDYPLLVRAAAPLLRDGVRLVVVGEGGERARIEAAIAEAVPPASRAFVMLAGQRSDVPRALAAMDVFVLSSRAEGLPLAIPEAMACRLPVVATSVGGIPAVVTKETGVLVPHGDPEALRGAIAGLLEDTAARLAMGEAARRHALDRFGDDAMLERYLALYAARR